MFFSENNCKNISRRIHFWVNATFGTMLVLCANFFDMLENKIKLLEIRAYRAGMEQDIFIKTNIGTWETGI